MVSVQTMTQPPKTRCVPGAIKSFNHMSGLTSFDSPSSHLDVSKVRFPPVLHLSGLQLSVFHEPYTTYPASQDEKRHLAPDSSAAATADNLVIASLGERLEQLARKPTVMGPPRCRYYMPSHTHRLIRRRARPPHAERYHLPTMLHGLQSNKRSRTTNSTSSSGG